MNADGSNLTQLTNNPETDWFPTWSPDGSRIAFASSRDGDFDIYVMNVESEIDMMEDDRSQVTEEDASNADGVKITQLTDNSHDDIYPMWSPDGSKIVFLSNRDGDPGDHEVYMMNADGSNVVKLNGSPAWSPDGSKIAFASDRDGDFEVYVMDADGSNVTQLTNNSDRDATPEWSPDGSKIAFVSDRDGDMLGI